MSYHAFVANIYGYHIFPPDPTFAICSMRDALETNLDKEENCIRDAYILGAAQWILWNGHSLFMQLCCPEDEHVRNKSPSQRVGKLYSGKPGLTVHRWAFWRERFAEIAAGKMPSVGDECKGVAGRAVDIMACLDRNLTF